MKTKLTQKLSLNKQSLFILTGKGKDKPEIPKDPTEVSKGGSCLSCVWIECTAL